MRRQHALLLVGFFCALTIALSLACNNKPGTNSAGGTGGTTGGKHKLSFVTNNASDFWTIARKGTEKAAKEIPGIEVEFRITSDGTAAGQQSIVDDLLAKGINGIAIHQPATVCATSAQIMSRPADKQVVSSKKPYRKAERSWCLLVCSMRKTL